MTHALPAEADSGLIGPNAVLQLYPLLVEQLGQAKAKALLRAAGMATLPPDTGLMPEDDARRLHQALRKRHPIDAPSLLREAGRRTANYVIAHRIPGPVARALKTMPATLATPLLVKSVERHAWTFAGSGGFRVSSSKPLRFEVTENPLIDGEHSAVPLCDWHTAVFQQLFCQLANPRLTVREVACAAKGDPACIFELS